MARSQAKVFVTIWASDDWRNLTLAGQWLYLLLLTQSRLNLAGCIDLMPSRWAALAPDVDLSIVRNALAELERADFVAIDQDTGELVIRTFTAHDLATGALNRNLIKGFWSAWEGIISRRLRHVVVANLPAEVWDRSKGLEPVEALKLRSEPQSEPWFEPQFPVDNLPEAHKPTSARSEPQFEPQSQSQFEPSAYRIPHTVIVTTAVDPSTTGATGGTSDDDRVKSTIALIADQRIARLAQPPANPDGYRQTVIGDVRRSHHDAIATMARAHPDRPAEVIAAAIEAPIPPAPRRTDPLEQAAKAQRTRDARLAAAARGEACPTCNGIGVTENADGTFTHCPNCRT